MCGNAYRKCMSKFYVADTRFKLNMLTLTVIDKDIHRFVTSEQHHHFYGMLPPLILLTIVLVIFNSVVLI